MINRRSFFMGALAAPLVVKTPGLLMPVKPIVQGGLLRWGDVVGISGPTGLNQFVVVETAAQSVGEWDWLMP